MIKITPATPLISQVKITNNQCMLLILYKYPPHNSHLLVNQATLDVFISKIYFIQVI